VTLYVEFAVGTSVGLILSEIGSPDVSLSVEFSVGSFVGTLLGESVSSDVTLSESLLLKPKASSPFSVDSSIFHQNTATTVHKTIYLK